jgi:hypothetical protein
MKLVVLNGVLLALMAVAVGMYGLVARTDSAIGGSVRRYAAAMSEADLDGAMAEIAPGRREAWRAWIAGQLGNVYEVRGIAVRSPSLLQGTGTPFEVSIVLDVNREYPDYFFQPTPRVPVEQVDGRWYLSQPPLADRDPGTQSE